MTTMSEPQPEYIQHNVKKGHEKLQQHARGLAHQTDMSQQEIADKLDVSRSVVAKALTMPGPRYQKMQRRVVELLSDYTVEREKEVNFRFLRKDKVEE